MDNIKKIFILGATHGNEFIGAHIVNNWPNVASAHNINSSIEILPILANPAAFTHKRRFIDQDLNRCFSLASLSDANIDGYENTRAKELNAILGPKTTPKNNNNFIIDLHTTNSSMGTTLMTSKKDAYKINLLKYISDRLADVNIIFTDDEAADRPYLGESTVVDNL